MWLGIIELVKKFFDLVTPWSTYWVDRRKASNAKNDAGQKKMDDAAKTGDYDAFLDGRADKHSA